MCVAAAALRQLAGYFADANVVSHGGLCPGLCVGDRDVQAIICVH